jgi:hypothetical protein
VVDVDRVLKRKGVLRQIDFAHFPEDLMPPVAASLFDQLRDRDLV